MNIKNKKFTYLSEVTRSYLLNKSRSQSKSRYAKRLDYKVNEYNNVDIPRLFDEDYFIFRTKINNYIAIVAFHGVFDTLKEVVKDKSVNGQVRRITLQMVIKALNLAFDRADDIQVSCDCADWRYRLAYHASRNGYKFGDLERRPSKITNPDDNLGALCKHLNSLLSNKKWMTKAASYINRWIKAYPEEATEYLFPDYEEKQNDLKKKSVYDRDDYDEIQSSQEENDDDVSDEVTSQEEEEMVIRENSEKLNDLKFAGKEEAKLTITESEAEILKKLLKRINHGNYSYDDQDVSIAKDLLYKIDGLF